MARDITEILVKGINLEALIKDNPELFNLRNFTVHDKIGLLETDPKYFSTLFDVTTFSPGEKVLTLLSLKKTSVTKLIKFSEDELKRLPGYQYGNLIQKDFSYMRAERFGDINKSDQSEIFLSHPQWVLDNVPTPPKFTSVLLASVAHRSPKFIDDHFEDFANLKTSYLFWNSMIKFDPAKYKILFLKNTKTMTSKTDVRSVFNYHPSLVKELTPDIMLDFKLTGKETVILINRLIKGKPKVFDNWKMPDDLSEALQLDLTAEMLNGKSKMSTRFQGTMKKVFKVDNEEDNE